MYKFISINILLLILAVGVCVAQNDLLSRVPELQETARLANGGAKGCGTGFYVLQTSRGAVNVRGGLDPIHVFGKKIVVAELLPLLAARRDANRTGKANQMSGDVGDLVYVVFSVIAQSKDPAAIPFAADLLEDEDDTIRGWAAIALFALGESSDELRQTVEKITFPKLAVQSVAGRGIKPPTWAKTAEAER